MVDSRGKAELWVIGWQCTRTHLKITELVIWCSGGSWVSKVGNLTSLAAHSDACQIDFHRAGQPSGFRACQWLSACQFISGSFLPGLMLT